MIQEINLWCIYIIFPGPFQESSTFSLWLLSPSLLSDLIFLIFKSNWVIHILPKAHRMKFKWLHSIECPLKIFLTKPICHTCAPCHSYTESVFLQITNLHFVQAIHKHYTGIFLHIFVEPNEPNLNVTSIMSYMSFPSGIEHSFPCALMVLCPTWGLDRINKGTVLEQISEIWAFSFFICKMVIIIWSIS